MKTSLEQLQIPKKSIEKLHSMEIADSLSLLNHCAFPKDRDRIAKELSINADDLLLWASVADLYRMKSVSLTLAKELASAYPNINAIATSDPVVLFDWITQNSKEEKIGLESVEEIVQEAQYLKNRLVLSVIQTENFEEIVRIDTEETNKNSKKIDAIWMKIYKILFILSALMIVLGSILNWHLWIPREIQFFIFAQLIEFLGVILFLLSGGLELFVFSVLVYSYFKWIQNWIFIDLLKKLKQFFFNNPVYQRFYMLSLQEYDNKKEAKNIQSSVILLGISAAISILLIPLEKLEWTILPVQIAILIMVVKLFMPIAQQAIDLQKRTVGTSKVVIQRFLIYRLTQWLMVPLLAMIIIQTFIGIFASINFIITKVFIAGYDFLISHLLQAINNLTLSSSDMLIREQLTTSYQYPYVRLAIQELFVTSLQDPFIQKGISIFSNILLMIIVGSIFVFYIFPLYKFGKFKEVTIFFAITFVSYFAEDLITKFVPGMLLISEHFLATIFILAAMILVNTVMFDWFLEESTEPKKFCVVCGQAIDTQLEYCPHCENPQPAMIED